MKRLMLLAILLIIATGCGGSGTSPEVWDLTGLAGIWDFTANVQGKLVPDEGADIPISDNYTGFWTVTKTTVMDDDGETYSWTYDGVTLILKLSDTYTESDPDCGDMFFNENETYVIKVTPSQTVANINGTLVGTFTSQFCGGGTLSATATGTTTKR